MLLQCTKINPGSFFLREGEATPDDIAVQVTKSLVESKDGFIVTQGDGLE